MDDINYINYLYELLDNKENKREYYNKFKLNIYLTLLSLNNNNYQESIQKEEINNIENYLKKINNLKVKIQLKRKEEEINKLLTEIKEIYQNNIDLISKYNKENLDIINILDSKEPKDITKLIDKLTKIKIYKIDKLEEHNNIRKNIISNMKNNNYYLEDNNLIINDNININIDKFYEIFDYLLDINQYQNVFLTNKANTSHKETIKNIIELLKNNNENNKNIIPIILNYLISLNNTNYEEIDTSKFKIDNIKISDLYSFANTNNEVDDTKVAKWRKVIIPNNYLYNKIKDIVNKGMYYFDNDNFILENIDKSISDFKVSINTNDMINFIKENIELYNANKTKTKHI